MDPEYVGRAATRWRWAPVVRNGGNPTDTWTWDGTAWAQLQIARAAPAGTWHVMFTSLDGDGVTIHGLGPPRDEFVQLHWQSSSPAEHCGPKDGDGDDVAGCLDLDCWPTCTPECPPATSCMSMPKCGDGMCNAIEDCWTCGADCGACSN